MDRKKNITPITNADYQAVINNSVQGAGSRLVGSAAEQKKLFVRPIANTDGSPNVMDYIKRLVTELAEVIAEGDLAVDELADVVDNATKELETKLTTTNKSEVLYGTDKEGKSKHYKLTDVKPIKGVDYWTDDDKQEINEHIDKEIAEFDFVKVLDELPAVGLPNREYFIRKTSSDTTDLFDEWAWINKGTEESPNWGWEFKGTKKLEIDLTEFVKFTDIATKSKPGVVKIWPEWGIHKDINGALVINTPTDTEIAEQSAVNSPLKPNQIPQVVKSGLVKHDSVTLTDKDKASACDWIGAVKKTDFGAGFFVSDDGEILMSSPIVALENRALYPVLGLTMDDAWKMVATGNQAEWTAEDWEKFYAFISAVKDYHTNRNGIVRYDDGHISMTYPTKDNHGATMKYVKDRVADKIASAVSDAKSYTDTKVSDARTYLSERVDGVGAIANQALSKAEAAYDARTETIYTTYTGGGQRKLVIGAWYMVFSNEDSLKICKADGTEVVSGARQMLFMTVPYSETEKEKFVVMGMYFYTGTLSITNPKIPMEFIQIQVDKGSYITAGSSATFNVSVRGGSLDI